MEKKTKAAWLLASAALILASCGGGEGGSSASVSEGSGSGSTTTSGDIEEGLFTNAQTPVGETLTIADSRPDAYTAYTPEGTEIGNYKDIASAINAAVDYDVNYNSTVTEDSWVFGSYVTKVGSTFRQFTNHQGYDLAGNNDEQFWFYEDGNTLNSYNCYDATDTAASLQGTNFIVHRVTGFGTTPTQFANSYKLLDSFGNEITDTSAQMWELSSTMDAAVIEFPARLRGITGLSYEIDLSGVKIAPPYEGCDKTYAFIGFYAWQDYYVIANGIACDTSTGDWYEFLGTSRDDSFSDVEYGLGECVMTSTKNADGYFVPNASTLKMSIETEILHDDEVDEDYQADHIKIECVGQGTYERRIVDSLVQNYFPGYPLGKENSYVFIAGLDIKNDTINAQYVENTDYFNGSYFTGLTVASAQAYVPAEDEMSDASYGYPIEASWRGSWHDILLSNDEDTDGVLDYAILNTCARASYTAKDKQDVFDFSYAVDAVTDAKLSGPAAEYQAKIDSLEGKTAEELLQDTSVYDEVATWAADDQTVIPQKYKNVLDFSAYEAAKELISGYSVSDAARSVADAISALSPIDYSGFGAIYTGDYAALSDSDKEVVRILVGSSAFDYLKGLYDFSLTLSSLTVADATIYGGDSWVFIGSSGPTGATETLTVSEAFDAVLDAAYRISQATAWTVGTENDDPNDAKSTIMNPDNNHWPSIRLIQLLDYFGGAGVELPSYVDHLKDVIGYDDYYTGLYEPIYYTVKLALRIDSDSITSLDQLTEDELSFLNTVWVSGYTISRQISWNWNSGNKFETYYSTRTRAVAYLAGGDGVTKTYEYFDKVGAFLTGLGYTLNSNGWGVTAATIA